MAYKKVGVMDILEVIRRRNAGQSITHISRSLGYDRKTVRKYLDGIEDYELSDNSGDKGEKFSQLHQGHPGRPSKKQELLTPFIEEIKRLVNHKTHPLKLKTAYEVICEKYGLAGKVSYVTFTRFVRRRSISIYPDRTTCRIESEPGNQVQVDYGRMGLLYDSLDGKRRTAYAFVGTLSYSRHKFIEFVYSQNQQSFVNSHVKMFTFFGGVPRTIALDNLKSGVIKPDLYEPNLNRAYREMAEYYGCFIDPCRVAKPKDKGKCERDVQTAREQFRKLISINPHITLSEANNKIKEWLKNSYGMKKHGTTHQEPYVLFEEIERPLLLQLPKEPYEAVLWKEALVHPDHYIQVNKKTYTIPHPYVGKKVWVKVTHNLIQVYYNEKQIKQHTIPRGFRQTDFNDFPENVRHAIDTGIPARLCRKASGIGIQFEKLIRTTLEPHAFLNLRRAQGLVSLAQKYPSEIIESAAEVALDSYTYVSPKIFKSIIKNIKQRKNDEEAQLALSEETKSFVRNADYFLNNK
jgi:transposase